MLKEITKEELSHATRSACLVEFYTPICPFCKELEKKLVAVSAEKPQIRVYKMDVSQQQEVARDLQIRSVPTLIRFDGGEIRDRLVGNASQEELLTRFVQ